MGKIIKNNVTYGGVPDEVITAWETEDVQDLPEITMGDADISDIGDGSITGAIAEHESDISTLNSKFHSIQTEAQLADWINSTTQTGDLVIFFASAAVTSKLTGGAITYAGVAILTRNTTVYYDGVIASYTPGKICVFRYSASTGTPDGVKTVTLS